MRSLISFLITTSLIILAATYFKLYQFADAMESSAKFFTPQQKSYMSNNCNDYDSISKINDISHKLYGIYVKYKQKQLNMNSFALEQNTNNNNCSNIKQKSVHRIYAAYLNVNNSVNNNRNIKDNKNNTSNKIESETNRYYNMNKNTNAQILRRHKSYDKYNDDVLTGHKCNNNTNNSNKNDYTYINSIPSNSTILLRQQQQDKWHRPVYISINDTLEYLYDHDHGNHYDQQKHKRQRRALNDFLIAPNTRWCGRGNTANNTYNRLGGALAADKCCRKHDHCPVFIPSLNKRFEIFNYRPYTLSHCSCDRRFRTCLKIANDEYAKAIGKIFFNVIQTQCIVLRKEHVCQKRAHNGDCILEHTKQRAYLRKNKKF